jgi:hypothetical protein
MGLTPPCRRSALRAGGLVLALLLTGCGEARKAVFPVKGKVLDADGNPAAGAKVIFHATDSQDPTAPHPVGVADAAGEFTLTTYKKDDGAPAGSYAVTVQWSPEGINPNSAFAGADRLKGRYATVQNSPFKATVGTASTTLEPFQVN